MRLGKAGKKADVSVSEPASNFVASRAIRAFIPPPTREQLMAGSANLRRVYKVEA
jgi:hypothetical protein